MHVPKPGWQTLILLIGVIVLAGAMIITWETVLPPHQTPPCTISPAPGETIVINESLNNAVICTTTNTSAVLRLGLYERVGAKWHISGSPGLTVSEGKLDMPVYAGIGTEEWNITPTEPGVQAVKAECIHYVSDGRIIANQNLTFIVT